ncbi:MAG: hypothetical protein V3S60_02315 [Acidimicrobiia bacterium]
MPPPTSIVDFRSDTVTRPTDEMRQAGVLAAAALIGLRDRDRLVEDHARAGDLRAGLSEMFSEAIGGGPSNMVTLSDDALPMTGEEFVDRMREQDVLVSLIKPGVVRFVTHRDVGDAAVDQRLWPQLVVLRGSSAVLFLCDGVVGAGGR